MLLISVEAAYFLTELDSFSHKKVYAPFDITRHFTGTDICLHLNDVRPIYNLCQKFIRSFIVIAL